MPDGGCALDVDARSAECDFLLARSRLGPANTSTVMLVALCILAGIGFAVTRVVSQLAGGSVRRDSEAGSGEVPGRSMIQHSPRASCASVGCNGKYDPFLDCQCTAQCVRFMNCCSDYSVLCKDHAPGERSLTAPLDVSLAADCLCLFDVDRTLTAKQTHCTDHGTSVVPGVQDNAYGGGPMTFSELAQNLKRTPCSRCYKGIISNGNVGGPHSAERRAILRALGGPKHTLTDTWENWHGHGGISTLMVGVRNSDKSLCAKDILQWLSHEHAVHLNINRVFFFDDTAANVRTFKGTGMNAQQISCRSRDSSTELGRCGGRSEEVSHRAGVILCSDKGFSPNGSA